MSILTVIKNNTKEELPFEGTPLLDELLTRAGLLIPHPCGGRGVCGKCAVRITGELSAPTETERQHGTRLSCTTRLLGDATLLWDTDERTMRIETNTAETISPLMSPGAEGFGAAIDIGTTTVALKLYDLSDGRCIGTAAAPNPQTSIAADVMGRIEAAMKGELTRLREMITQTVTELLQQASPDRIPPMPLTVTVTGNTTMLYLLCGYDPTPLSRAPFVADHLFGTELTLPQFPTPVYLPPCMNAFVGADITCAVLASGMCDRPETSLLCDIGTNGELALWKDGHLYVTSTAAGPAFEGAGITCGCGSITGAIDRVWVENGQLRIHTIGDAAPAGLCGSGVIDAVAAGLQLEEIDESGAMDEPLTLSDQVVLHPRDVRAVQLAKAAIAAGIDTLLEISHTAPDQIDTFYIAGGFGSHLNQESAIAIGLLPNIPTDRIQILGNAALHGAAMTLTDPTIRRQLTHIAVLSQHINLGGNPRFSEHYIDRMIFGEE